MEQSFFFCLRIFSGITTFCIYLSSSIKKLSDEA